MTHSDFFESLGPLGLTVQVGGDCRPDTTPIATVAAAAGGAIAAITGAAVPGSNGHGNIGGDNDEEDMAKRKRLASRRDGRGECKSCGIKLFHIKTGGGVFGKFVGKKKIPITEKGKVLNGRCLECFPLVVDDCDEVCVVEVPTELEVRRYTSEGEISGISFEDYCYDDEDDEDETYFMMIPGSDSRQGRARPITSTLHNKDTIKKLRERQMQLPGAKDGEDGGGDDQDEAAVPPPPRRGPRRVSSRGSGLARVASITWVPTTINEHDDENDKESSDGGLAGLVGLPPSPTKATKAKAGAGAGPKAPAIQQPKEGDEEYINYLLESSFRLNNDEAPINVGASAPAPVTSTKTTNTTASATAKQKQLQSEEVVPTPSVTGGLSSPQISCTYSYTDSSFAIIDTNRIMGCWDDDSTTEDDDTDPATTSNKNKNKLLFEDDDEDKDEALDGDEFGGLLGAAAGPQHPTTITSGKTPLSSKDSMLSTDTTPTMSLSSLDYPVSPSPPYDYSNSRTRIRHGDLACTSPSSEKLKRESRSICL